MVSQRKKVTTILLVDDHSVVRAGVRLLLEPVEGTEIVGEAANADEALAALRRHRPDVVMLDISMPGIGGIELTRRIRREFPETRVIILTFHEGDEYLFQALQAGASGYVVKGAAPGELVNALQAVMADGMYLDPGRVRRLAETSIEGRRLAAFAPLSNREREVAELLLEGKSNQEVADELFISVTTVQTHRAHIMEKLGLANFGEFIRYAIRMGAIEP